MTRCVEWYDKFEKDGNFCGLSVSGISQVKAYNEMREKIAVHVPDKAFVVENFPEGASRVLASVKDDETRLKGLNYVIESLKRKEKVTAGDLKQTIKGWLQPESCNVEKHADNLGHVSENFTNVKSPSEKVPDPDLPPQPSLAKQIGNPGTVELPQETPAKLTREIVTPSLPTSAPCLAGYRCPEGGVVILPEKNSIHGKRCSVNMQEIFQKNGKSALFRDECPILVAAAKKLNPPAVEGFHTVSLNGARPITNELRPMQKRPVQMEILWKPSPKMQDFIVRLMKALMVDTPAEALDEIVSRAMEAE